MITMPSIDMAATGRNIARLRKTIDNLIALAMIFEVSMEDIIVLNVNARARRCA